MKPRHHLAQISNQSSSIVIFDGICNLCNGFVNFAIDRDPHFTFKFVANQSEIGQRLIQDFQLPLTLDTIVLIEGDRCYTHSTAALKIFSQLTGAWAWCGYLTIVPRPLRDLIYNWIAHNRYRWLGKSVSCRMPTPELQKHFLN